MQYGKKSALLFLLISCVSWSFIQAQSTLKKKIIIFSGHGGGGHMSVANAIKSYLGDDYTIDVAFMFDEILKETDIIQKISNEQMTGDDFYNMLIKKKFHNLLNVMYETGKISFKLQEPTIEKILFAYFEKSKPDLIISVIPLVNNAILQIAHVLNIPFLLIPTDLDPTMALNGIKKPTYQKFKLGLSYNAPSINKKVTPHLIGSNSISYVGFPVKRCFLDRKYCKSIDEFSLPKNKPIILLLMGSQGSKELYEYAKAFTKVTVPVHLVIAIGKSPEMAKKIKGISFPKNITYTIVGFTDKIPELMHAADLFVSKSGGVSVNESIYAQLPMLLDAASTLLKWEKFSIDFVTKHNFGRPIKKIRTLFSNDFANEINDLFGKKGKLGSYKKSLLAFKKANPQVAIKGLVESMI